MQFLVNNSITTISQPQNAFISTNPVTLGNYTYNNNVYASMNETRSFTANKLLGIVAGDSDRIIDYEITLTPNKDTLLVDTPKVELYILSNISTLTHACSEFTVTYTTSAQHALHASHTITVNKPTYLECIADMINQINANEHINMSYEHITLTNNRDVVKIYTPVNISLTLPSELMYSNGYIAYIAYIGDIEETGTIISTVVSTIPINGIYSGQTIVRWCTLNNQNGILAISTTTPCDINVTETMTIIN